MAKPRQLVVSAMVQLQQELAFWQGKAAKLKLLGEDKTYKWGYELCLERITLFQRVLDRRLGVHPLSSSTKPRL